MRPAPFSISPLFWSRPKAWRVLPGGEDSQHDEQSLEALRERDLLFARLLQYRAYKQAAGDFRARIAANAGRFPHPAAMDEGIAAMLPELVWTLTPLELAQLAAQVIANAPASEVSIHQLHVPLVDLRAQSLVVRDRLIAALESKGDQSISFSELTRDCTSRIEVVARVHGRARVLQTRCAAVSARWSVLPNCT